MEKDKDRKTKNILTWGMLVGIWLGGTAIVYTLVWKEDIVLLLSSKRSLFLLSYVAIGFLYFSWVFYKNVRLGWEAQHFNCLFKIPNKIRHFLVFLILAFPLSFFFLITYFEKPYSSWVGLFLILFCSSLASLFISKDLSWQTAAKRWAVYLIIATLLFIIGKELNTISNYPFSMGWSETSRYYLASLLRDKEIYGIDLPLPHRNLTRYLMQSVPFFIPGAGLWLHRLWEAALRVVLPFLTTFFFIRRLNIDNKKLKIFAWLWGGLFIMQGPVFYPMLIIMLMIFITFDSKKLWPSTIWVIVASIWAGLTRINWIPMPAVIAIMLYVLENRIGFEKKFSKAVSYFSFPILWGVIGILSGLFSQEFYQLNSGLSKTLFSTDFSSDLLWNRLLPNISYSPGILLGILAITFPILFFMTLTLLNNKKNWHLTRTISLFGILLVLFLGGLIVSTKIGGGTNLHNMDVYIVAVYIFGNYLYFNQYNNEIQTEYSVPSSNILFIIIIFLPVLFHGLNGNPAARKNIEVAEADLLKLETLVNDYKDDGEVLFIAERHLLTFGKIENVEFVNEYEKMILMEMTMGRNMDYLNEFYEDLREHRFSFILTESITTLIKNPDEYPLAEENNVFVELVSEPIYCYYELLETLREENLMVWIPLEENKCP